MVGYLLVGVLILAGFSFNFVEQNMDTLLIILLILLLFGSSGWYGYRRWPEYGPGIGIVGLVLVVVLIVVLAGGIGSHWRW
jgi:hypothetical protein